MAEPARAGRFDRDTAVALEVDQGPRRRYAATVSPDWRAGRGPHGGYLAAIVLRALTQAVDERERAPRSLTIHFARAPEPGPVTIETVLERRGRSLSTLSARMEQEGRVCALALAAFSVPWSAPSVHEMPAPEVQPPGPVSDWEGELPPQAPPIARMLRFQPRLGGRPLSGGEQPMEIGGWVGVAESRPLDALALAFLSDALVPGPFMRMSAPSPAPTIDLTVHFRVALPRGPDPDPEELCLMRVRAHEINEGFFDEDTVIWAADGTVLAHSRQLALLLGAPAD